MYMKSMLRFSACLILMIAIAKAAGPVGYLYSAFTGDGEDGLHLLSSRDGLTWKSVKDYQCIYKQSEGLMRDPSICHGGDGMYHLVWTTGWWNDTIGIAHSKDLISWTPSEFLHVWADYRGPGGETADAKRWPADLTKVAPRHPKVRNCWAPEIFFDDATQEYVIFWATTIDDPGVFPKTWNAHRWERMNQRIYAITSKDFKTYTPRRPFYAPADRVVIDACIAKTAPGKYRLVIKDENAQRLHVCQQTQPLTTWAAMPADFWGPMSKNAFTGPGIKPDDTQAEGPSVLRIGDQWLVYCDYWAAKHNGLFITTDFSTLNRANECFKAPVWVRHGTAFAVPLTTLDALESLSAKH